MSDGRQPTLRSASDINVSGPLRYELRCRMESKDNVGEVERKEASFKEREMPKVRKGNLVRKLRTSRPRSGNIQTE